MSVGASSQVSDGVLPFFRSGLRLPPFKLPEDFISSYRGKQPDWGPIGYITFKRTYARPIEGTSRTEEFWETCRRVVEGTFFILRCHVANSGLPWNEAFVQNAAKKMYDAMWNFRFLPAGRGLWTMGTKMLLKLGSTALNSCAFISTKDIDSDFSMPFTFGMDVLMLGVGVGVDCRGAGRRRITEPMVDRRLHHVLPDTREGWVDALRIVLNAYVGKEALPEAFDFSEIRPAGTPLKGFGGVAAGPGPLKRLVLEDVPRILNRRVGQYLTSTDIVDLFDVIGKCVVSGNIRRSAVLVLGEADDHEFMTLKDPDLHPEELASHRWLSNNSIFGHRGMDYSDVAKSIRQNGEPGIMWLENARAYGRMSDMPNWNDDDVLGCNACAEMSLSSAELCNLVETFPSRHETPDDMLDTLAFAHLYGKIVTLAPSHIERTTKIIAANRRMGVSMSGIAAAYARFGKNWGNDWYDRYYKYLRSADVALSRQLGIRESIKLTSIKPSGTISLLPGVSPGAHWPHAEYYIRRVRFASNSELLQVLRQAGYRMEPDVVDMTATVVEFPVRERNFTKSENDVSMQDQLESAAQLQRDYSDNQVSVTVKFDRDTEGNHIARALQDYESRLKCAAFLPKSNARYAQMPYESIAKEAYEEYSRALKPLRLDESAHETEDAYCDGDKCTVPRR